MTGLMAYILSRRYAAEEARQAVKIETVKLNGTPLTPDAQKAVNVTAVQQSDLATYSLISETGNKIDLEINSSTYVLTAKLYDKNNNLISTSSPIDLPIEEMIISVSYDSTTKELVITLKSGTVVRVPIGDIISGLATQTWVTSGFVAKETGKGLSTNDYSNTEKTKLSGIENGAQVNIVETVKVNGTPITPDTQKAVNVVVPDLNLAVDDNGYLCVVVA